MADNLTPFDVVLAACNQAYEIEHGRPHPSVPTKFDRFKSVWAKCGFPDIFNGWGGFLKWLNS